MKINLYMTKSYYFKGGWSKTYTIIEQRTKDILFQASTRGPSIQVDKTIKQFENIPKEIVELCRDLSQYSYRNSEIKIDWNTHITPLLK